MTAFTTLRLDGLEPDNLLAFMSLLGVLRTLDATSPEWHTRVSWTVDEPPLRPALRVPHGVSEKDITAAVAEGLDQLASRHQFAGRKDLNLPAEEATKALRDVSNPANSDSYSGELWSALITDTAISRDGKKVEPTPLCLMFGQGHQHFLERLASVPKLKCPPERGAGRSKVAVSELESLREALFSTWMRPDKTQSFRWDPNEDVRYAHRARDPTDPKTKETNQHGANRLAAVGLSTLTVVPTIRRGEVRLGVVGGRRDAKGGFEFRWPIWKSPISLASVRALLVHPRLEGLETQAALDIVELRTARRVSSGKFMNFTRAESRRET